MSIVKIFRKGWIVVAIIGATAVLQGCLNSDNEPDYDPYEYLSKDIETIKTYLKDNNIDAQMDTASGIFIQTHSKGDGYQTLNGVKIDANYKGTTLEGVEFVNTFSGATPRITLGRDSNPSNYTAGLNIGLINMSEGDSATIYVPSPYGFQDQGYQNVPPHSILVYNVKFEDVLLLSEDFAKIDQYISDNNIDATIDDVYGTRYAIHREGNGESPEINSYVSLHYVGKLVDGTVFQSSYDLGSTYDFIFRSTNQTDSRPVVGFEMGLSHLHENDSATIFIPSIYGYGDKTNGEIPANSVLIFGLEIKKINNL